MKITASNKVPVAHDPANPPTAKSSGETNAKSSTADAVGKKALQDPLRQLRDHVIETSAHAAHQTAESLAKNLKGAKKLGTIASAGVQIVTIISEYLSAHAQDGHKTAVTWHSSRHTARPV